MHFLNCCKCTTVPPLNAQGLCSGMTAHTTASLHVTPILLRHAFFNFNRYHTKNCTSSERYEKKNLTLNSHNDWLLQKYKRNNIKKMKKIILMTGCGRGSWMIRPLMKVY